MKSTYSIDIAAPQNRVFEYVDEDDKVKEWVDGLMETSYPEGKNTDTPVGTKFKQKLKEGGRIKEYTGEVTKYDKPHLICIRLYDKMFTVDVCYRFTAIPQGTRLSYESEITFHNWFSRMMGKFFAGESQRILEKQMLKLKELAESKK
jgi:uncharacterized protein YndB with AHSA1/START domain